MSKQLYEEALAEVRQLKQIAEDNAKKAIMEEVTPRIKQLIESQILENSGDHEEDDILHDDPVVDKDEEKPSSETVENTFEVSTAVEGVLRNLMKSQPQRLREFKVVTHRLKKRIISEIKTGNDLGNLLETLKVVYVMLQEKVEDSSDRQRLEELLDSYYKTILNYQEKNEMNFRRGRRINEASLDIKIDGFPDDVLDDDTLDDLDIEISPSTEGGEGDEGEGEEGGDDLDLDADEEGGEDEEGEEGEEDFDLGDEEGEDEESEDSEDELSLDDTGDEEEETKEESYMENASLGDNTVVEIDEGMLRREIARMKSLREERSAAPVEKKSVKGKKMTPKVLSAFGGGRSEGDAWLDGEVTTESLDEIELDETELDEMGDAHGMDETYEGMDEKSHDASGSPEMDETYEGEGLDEFDLGELDGGEEEGNVGGAGMVEDSGCSEVGEAEDVAGLGGHSDAEQDTGQERQPEARRRLGRVLEARKAAILKGKKARRIMENARRSGNKSLYLRAKKVYTEAAGAFVKATKVARVLQESMKRGSNSNAGRQVTALRKQLAETNLFNAKLLYTNKLLQNDSLTPRQKVTIIEKLDEARSLREAKLVYESLTRTISSGKERISEGASRQVLGSASRATRPGSTVSLNEGFESARWAKLAGITK